MPAFPLFRSSQAIARYRAAVDMKNELDPDFVVMAQCYARDATNSSFDDSLVRLKAYKQEAGVDWVQLESPHSVEEIKRARAVVDGPFSFMKGKMPRYLTLEEHMALGVNIAWFPGFTHHVLWAALWDFMNDFQSRGSRRGRSSSPAGATGPIRSRRLERMARERRCSSGLKNFYSRRG